MKRKTGLFSTGFAFHVLAIAIAYCLLLSDRSAHGQSIQPCADDIIKYCKDIQPGGGRMAQCLALHARDMSPACKKRIGEIKNRMISVSEACEDDVMELCNDVRPGGVRILNCLKEHAEDVSSECKAALGEGKWKKH